MIRGLLKVSKITISGLQQYLKQKDYHPERKLDYFLKLSEEVGELAKAIYEKRTPASETDFKGTIEEEIFDVIYYLFGLANVYDIDIEKWIYVKEQLNDIKYGTNYSVKLKNIE